MYAIRSYYEWQDVRSYEWHRHRTLRVLTGWHQDPDFVDEQGQPLALPFEGAGASFSTLCQRYSGDIGPRAMLEELKAIDSVSAQANGTWRVLTRSYRTQRVDADALMHFADAVHDLVASLDYNLQTPIPQHRFEGVASTPRLDPVITSYSIHYTKLYEWRLHSPGLPAWPAVQSANP